MPAIKRDLSNPDKVSLTIDLDELFDGNVADRPAARQALAQDIIDKIVSSAEHGEGVSSDLKKRTELRKPYSSGYSHSQEFKAFEKDPGKINMTLTGSMLSALNVLEENKHRIVIGWEEGSEDGKKAHGNITGQDGKSPKMKRDFFGITQSELKEISSDYKDDFKIAPKESTTVADLLAIIGAARKLFG